MATCPWCGRTDTCVTVEVVPHGVMFRRCLACHLAWHVLERHHVRWLRADRLIRAENARWRAAFDTH